MIKGKFYFIILGIIFVAAILLRITTFFSDKPNETMQPKEAVESFTLEGDSKTESVVTGTALVNNNEEDKSEPVIINSPQPSEIVSSPLVVSGQARGFWFFEGSLPVKLVDESGNVIAVTPAQAESDWMTTDLVPFKALLNFTSTSTGGYLIISKDNPSGLAVNDASISIPLRFLTK